MKRFIFVLISVLLLASCSSGMQNAGLSVSPDSAGAEVTDTTAPSGTPEPAFTAVNASWPEMILSPDAVLGNYTYYLDTAKVLTDGKETGCMLWRRDNTTGAEEPLNILSYSIAAFGSHLYFLAWSGKGDNFHMQGNWVNTLYRLDNGGGRTFICNGWFLDNVYRALYVNGNTLYFTRFKECAIFKADLDCENIERIPLVVPEESDPLEYCKKMARGELFTEIELGYSYDESDLININYHVFGDGFNMYFSGDYTMSTDNYNIEKISSQYWNNNIDTGGWIYYLDLENWIENDYGFLYRIHRVKQDGSGDENLNIICSDFKIDGGWIYYFDRENPIKTDDIDVTFYNIHRVKLDGNGDENLNIVSSEFDIIGEYIYVDSDFEYGDRTHWITYRYNMDGTGKKRLMFSDMTRYMISGSLYFTTYDDKAIYAADTSCSDVKKIKITIPDDKELKGQIDDGDDSCFEHCSIAITGLDGGWLYFDYRAESEFANYTGGYRIDLNNGKVEKTNEGVFDYPYLGE